MRGELRPRVVLGCVLVLVGFAFWQSLFAGGSLVSNDVVLATAPPFDAYHPADASVENGPGDTIAIHSHWASLADDVRGGDVGWWNHDLAGGQPTMKGGLPVFSAAYLVVPDWFAPGLVAVIRTLVAIGLTLGYLRSIRLSWTAALTGAIAFGFSGFMVGWMNWPQSSVAAFAPGLLWALESILRSPRIWRGVPLGLCVTAMVWASFPAVLVYVLAGAAVYTAIRLVALRSDGTATIRWLGRVGSVVGVAMVIVALLALPYVLGFQEYLDWGDTSSREGNPDDSSAGVGYLLTTFAPAIWGSDAVGPAWFGEGNWVEFNSHAGASVALLALVGVVAGVRSRDRWRRSVAIGLASVALLGLVIAYLGGPVGVALGSLTGPLGGLMTRAKVLLSLGLALGAALGVDRLTRPDEEGRDLRTDLRASALVGLLAVVALTPSILNWLDAARAAGAVREVVAVSTMSIVAFVAVLAVIAARVTGRCSARMAGAVFVVVVSVELLSFMMPVPTTATRAERLAETPAHETVRSILGPGERLGGEGRAFFVATAQLFDLPDVRGHLLKSEGYQALLREEDPVMLTKEGGGTATSPNVPIGTDPRDPIWQAMGVGAWAQYPDSVPIGSLRAPAEPTKYVSTSAAPAVGTLLVPEGGLRAVIVPVSVLEPGQLDIQITTIDGTTSEQRWLDTFDETASFAVLGERLPVGSTVTVAVGSASDSVRVGLDDAGGPALGWVAGDDELELVRTGDVILFDIAGAPASLATDAVVASDPDEAARLVAAGSVVVERPLVEVGSGIPDVVPVRDVAYGTDEVTIRTDYGEPALLVVPITDYPGWSARLDGAAAEIVTANAAFIGVEVPAGSHEIVLRFRPTRLGLEIGMMGLGVVLCAALLAGPMVRHRSRLRPRRP